MIAPMIKYSMLIYHREYSRFLDRMRELGVVHIVEKESAINDEIREQYQYIDRVDKAIRFLKKREIDTVETTEKLDGEKLFNEIVELQQNIDYNQNRLNSLKKEINELLPWGEFSIKTIDLLKKEGINIRFFISPVRKFEQSWVEKYTLSIINTLSGNIYFIAVEQESETVEIQAEEIAAPKESLKGLKEAHTNLEKEIEAVESRFNHIAKHGTKALEHYKNRLTENLEYEKAICFTAKEAEDRVMVVEGWIPEQKVADLDNFLAGTGAAYITSKPGKEEKAPILLKNKKFAEKFEKLGELYSLPTYNEMDITPFFAPFYALFFGFCLGDAGYGILMVIASIIARRKVRKELKPMAVLVTYLGSATILFGLLGGTFFGINLYQSNLPVYRELSVMLEERGTDINMLLFYLSILLGAIQIMFGMVLKAVNETIQFGWKYAVGTYGWLTLIFGTILLFSISKITGVPMSSLSVPLNILLIFSGIMILPLNNLNRNVFANFGLGLWNTYNMATGLLGDLLSYIRLFALGISSAILGFVFNSLAVSMSGNIPVVSILVMVVILVFGHGINLFMSGLGSFVHPMRLTFVEFYKNAGFSGGGKKYNPFRKIN